MPAKGKRRGGSWPHIVLFPSSSAVSLFNRNCDVIKEYGTGPRNLVSYNPSGTMLCIAGFGNLRGGMEFWERSTHTCVSKLQAADSTVFAWCPDSRHILTATTSPRLKVENGLVGRGRGGSGEGMWDGCSTPHSPFLSYKLWHYTKGFLWKVDVKELWAAAWQPVPAERYPERPRSPVPANAMLSDGKPAGG